MCIEGWTRDCSDYSLQRREIDFSEWWIEAGAGDRFKDSLLLLEGGENF